MMSQTPSDTTETGCDPDRQTWVALENAGFEDVNYQHFQAKVFPIVNPHIIGIATKKTI